jgi:hypothetical protein
MQQTDDDDKAVRRERAPYKTLPNARALEHWERELLRLEWPDFCDQIVWPAAAERKRSVPAAMLLELERRVYALPAGVAENETRWFPIVTLATLLQQSDPRVYNDTDLWNAICAHLPRTSATYKRVMLDVGRDFSLPGYDNVLFHFFLNIVGRRGDAAPHAARHALLEYPAVWAPTYIGAPAAGAGNQPLTAVNGYAIVRVPAKDGDPVPPPPENDRAARQWFEVQLTAALWSDGNNVAVTCDLAGNSLGPAISDALWYLSDDTNPDGAKETLFNDLVWVTQTITRVVETLPTDSVLSLSDSLSDEYLEIFERAPETAFIVRALAALRSIWRQFEYVADEDFLF